MTVDILLFTMAKTKKTNVSPKGQMTVAAAFFECMRIGCKNKEQAIKSMMELLGKSGTLKTKNGNPISTKLVTRQFNAMVYDVKKQRGRWKEFKYIEKKDLIQILQN